MRCRTSYARVKGSKYLCGVLKPVVKRMIASHVSYEMDPNRVSLEVKQAKAWQEKNAKQLHKLSQNVLSAIFGQRDDFPL
jgi:hypothetical protein